MSLYDDLDTLRQKSDEVAGWSSGIKLFQSQLQAKKAASSTKRDSNKKTNILLPVFDLNTKRDDDDTEDNKEGRFSSSCDSFFFSFVGGDPRRPPNVVSQGLGTQTVDMIPTNNPRDTQFSGSREGSHSSYPLKNLDT